MYLFSGTDLPGNIYSFLRHALAPPGCSCLVQVMSLRDLAQQKWAARRERIQQSTVRRQGPEDWREAFNQALREAEHSIRYPPQ